MYLLLLYWLCDNRNLDKEHPNIKEIRHAISLNNPFVCTARRTISATGTTFSPSLNQSEIDVKECDIDCENVPHMYTVVEQVFSKYTAACNTGLFNTFSRNLKFNS